ncbi:MAG: septation protein IspZ [Bdellovibrionia bacterium]
MERLKPLAKVAFENFGPVLVFYAVNHFYGLRPAIAASALYTVAEIISKVRKKEKLTSLFKFSAIMTLIFGAVDLYSQQTFMFKYEACVSNVFTGLFFGASLLSEKTVLQEFREKSGNHGPVTQDRVAYFKILTAIWVIYFFAKAGAYYWMASHMSLEQGLMLRTILGSASFYAMLFISIFGSKKIFPLMKKWNLLPRSEAESSLT